MSEPIVEYFSGDGVFPNSRLPLLIYRLAVSNPGPEAMERCFAAGDWPPAWRSGIFPFDHYHSTAHECLGIAAGAARLLLGGPQGREFAVTAGDVIIIPAGVAHRRLSSSPDFLVVGAYPPGQDWDLLRGAPGERPKADENIRNVPLPKTDPVEGKEGALIGVWR